MCRSQSVLGTTHDIELQVPNPEHEDVATMIALQGIVLIRSWRGTASETGAANGLRICQPCDILRANLDETALQGYQMEPDGLCLLRVL